MLRALESVGTALGWVTGPVWALTSLLRRARTLHPSGRVYTAHVEGEAHDPKLAPLAARLEGEALVRLSSSLWKRAVIKPEILGIAIRFQGVRSGVREDSARSSRPAAAGEQDLLFATATRPYTLPFAAFCTNVDDFLANDYFAMAPFDIDGFGRGYLRVRPRAAPEEPRRSPDARAARQAGEGTRTERLERAVLAGDAVFHLEVSRRARGPWLPLARMTLRARALVRDETLRFDPFLTRLGIVPRGAIHALRRGAYTFSKADLLLHAMRPHGGDGKVDPSRVSPRLRPPPRERLRVRA